MRIKNQIAIFLLAIYSVVLVHSFIPHEHHNDFFECGKSCSTHNEFISEKCTTTFHSHENKPHKHLHCHFNVKLVLTKFIDISDLFIDKSCEELIVAEFEGEKINHFCFLQIIPEPQCRDVNLRAPPVFS
ncbi:MAG: hypothetical protein JW833_12570 [Prolixibacteraceae bacterium]|nr:hypothetical protein [Prolixibacteraceae bacterium]